MDQYLGDFGISAQITASIAKRKSFIGTPYWYDYPFLTIFNIVTCYVRISAYFFCKMVFHLTETTD